MKVSGESKRLWRTAFIVAGVGLIVLVPLAWLAYRMQQDSVQRRIIGANESAAISAMESISAAQHLYFQTYGQYGTFPQLVESGLFQAPLTGDALVARGYAFTLKVTQGSEGVQPFYSVNADPQDDSGRDATGRRHFYIDSNITGMRVSEGRPATPADPPRLTIQQ